MADVTNSKLQDTAGIRIHTDACVVIVKTEWNQKVVDELEKGCRKFLVKSGLTEIITLTVPGAFEIPFAIRNYWEKSGKGADAFIALGCVQRGDTPHFDYVCKAVTDGVLQLNLMLPVPTIFGVLTVNTAKQAQQRIGGKHGHKGEEAAITAIKMIALNRQ